ncbi:MAG TPA: trypsin-like peptidase domain-containing protein [Actinocrinis sp.]|nr:trypsin-like peptidase domain-containing protein [Actinocrinis sp.]
MEPATSDGPAAAGAETPASDASPAEPTAVLPSYPDETPADAAPPARSQDGGSVEGRPFPGQPDSTPAHPAPASPAQAETPQPAPAPAPEVPSPGLQSPAGPSPLPPTPGMPGMTPQPAPYPSYQGTEHTAPLPSTPIPAAVPPQPHPQPGPMWGAPPAHPTAPPQAWGAVPAPGGPGVPPPPNWATPAPSGLSPFGGPDPNAAAQEPKKPGGPGRMVLVAAIVAALIGAGVGAGVTYALKGNNNSSSASSLTSSNSTSTGSGLNTASPNSTQVTSVAAKVLPSVVTITVTASDGSGDEGTGIIISSDGQILTNNHVIATAATSNASVTVTFDNGKITPATILGRDTSSDLAVIKASGVTGLTKADLGDSSTLSVGQAVVAIGAPLGLSNTVTTGIVSALNRPVSPSSDSSSSSQSNSVLDAIQTDAAINPGNSGGPLVDMSGKVIGINSAIATASSDSLSGGTSGSIGLGFAIPINQAEWVAKELVASGTATHSLLGVSVTDPTATATQAGAVVGTVTAGGPADKAGLKKGDVITKVDDQQIGGADSLVAAIRSYQPGTKVMLTYQRGGQATTAQVTLSSATTS